MGFGWKNVHGVGKGGDAITSGIEVHGQPTLQNGIMDILNYFQI